MVRVLNLFGALFLLAALVVGQQGYPPSGDPAAGEQQQGSPQTMGPSIGGPQFGAPQGGAQPGDAGEAADQQHGVARVSLLGGNVNLQRAGSTDLVAAVVNAPLLSRDRLQTGPGSSAEIQLDAFTVVRLAENTDLGFGDRLAGRAQMQLGAGTVIFRFLRDSQFQADIETPIVAVHPLGAADLRISVLENGTSQVTVRGGAADLYGPGGTQRLEAGRSVLVRAGANGPEFQEAALPAHDPLDDWSTACDNAILSSATASAQYTGSDMAGIGDLGANGSWVGSQYGPVWTPRSAPAGWAPYSDGQWVDEPYYGWTWVDAEPWGWAPFHYGRWFWNGGHGWCWWPGAVGYSHVWGPAFVGFFGFGGGGGLGWVALAPFEEFHAWWGRGGYRGGYGFSANRASFGGFQNAAYRGGAIGASFGAFSSYRGRFNPVSREALGGASPIRGALPVSTAGYRFHFTDRQAIPNPRLASAAGRSFYQPPHSGFSNSAARAGFGSNAYRPTQRYSGPAAGSASGGWQHFGDPRTSAGVRQTFTPAQGESGWHQFGQPERSQPSAQRYGQSSSSYRNFGSSQPSYRQATPNYHQSAPSYHQAAPSYHQSAPAYHPSAPASSASRGFSSGGGQRYSSPAPRSQSGGGGSHGGGGGQSHGGGNGGGHHR